MVHAYRTERVSGFQGQLMKPILALLATTLWLGDASSQAGKQETEKPTGCEVGAEVPLFYVKQVTSRRPNLAVCLVCQNGDRPVVLIAVRKLNKQLERLLHAVDRKVDAHRADGLRSFAIFLTSDSRKLQPALMTLSRERKLTIPLTIPVEAETGPRSLELPEDVSTIVLFYVNRRIVAESRFKSGQLTDDKIEGLIRKTDMLLSKKRSLSGSHSESTK